MYFGEPQTDLRTELTSDDGHTIAIDFKVDGGAWLLKTAKDLPRDTLREMVTYLYKQFYLGDEDSFLDDWLSVVDRADLSQPVKLKTVDRR